MVFFQGSEFVCSIGAKRAEHREDDLLFQLKMRSKSPLQSKGGCLRVAQVAFDEHCVHMRKERGDSLVLFADLVRRAPDSTAELCRVRHRWG